jgi:hypothetical protein
MAYEANVTEGFGELAGALNTQWERFSAAELAGLRKKMGKLVAAEIIPQASLEETVKNREAEYAGFDDDRKAVALLNNLHLWLPAGWNRTPTILEQKDEENRQEAERIMHDVDEIIAEKGYTDEDFSPSDPHRRLRTLFGLYLAMLERGWDPDTII